MTDEVNSTNSVITRPLIPLKVENGNPFIDDEFQNQFDIKTCKKATGVVGFESEMGDIAQTIEGYAHSQVVVDRQPYWKSFKGGFDVQSKLSLNGLRMYLYVANNLKPCDDSFVLSSIDDVMAKFSWKSASMVYKGISELIEHGVLSKKNKRGYDYWVNLKLFYNGNRVTKTKTFIKQLKPEIVNGVVVRRYEKVTETIEVEENN